MNGIYVPFVILFVAVTTLSLVPEAVFVALLSRRIKTTQKDVDKMNRHLELLKQQEQDAIKELERRPDIWV